MRGALQFAVVREDARTVLALLEASGARRPLLVASGGCTLLAVLVHAPHVRPLALDPNPAQLEHARRKAAELERALSTRNFTRLGVGAAGPDSLAECGNFEALFRLWRHVVDDFVVARQVRERLFDDAASLARGTQELLASRWWKTAFEIVFADAPLETMFGPAATQHAVRGSYPGWFQRAFERGLARADALDNPFLHHLLLGHYLERPSAWPDFLAGGAAHTTRATLGPLGPLELVQATFQDHGDLAAHDFIDLSNVLDWMAPDEVDALLARCAQELRPGAMLVWRQLNNDRDLEARTRGAFAFDHTLAARLFAADRSLFYSSLHVGRRT
jgi:S-adenosylmethionine-diacylglycerol 3-amino-3-carboxypropyl transferase